MSDFGQVEAAMIFLLNERYEADNVAVSWCELVAGLESVTTDHRLIARVQAHLRSRKLVMGRLAWEGLDVREEEDDYDCVVLPAIHAAANTQTPAAAAPMSEFRRVEAAMIRWLNARYEADTDEFVFSELVAGLASETADHDLIRRVRDHLCTCNLLKVEWYWIGEGPRAGEKDEYKCVILSAIRDAAKTQTPAAAAPVVTINPPQVVIDGNAYALSLDAAEYLHVLSKRYGERMSDREVIECSAVLKTAYTDRPRLKRIRDSLPEQVALWLDYDNRGTKFRRPV